MTVLWTLQAQSAFVVIFKNVLSFTVIRALGDLVYFIMFNTRAVLPVIFELGNPDCITVFQTLIFCLNSLPLNVVETALFLPYGSSVAAIKTTFLEELNFSEPSALLRSSCYRLRSSVSLQ